MNDQPQPDLAKLTQAVGVADALFVLRWLIQCHECQGVNIWLPENILGLSQRAIEILGKQPSPAKCDECERLYRDSEHDQKTIENLRIENTQLRQRCTQLRDEWTVRVDEHMRECLIAISGIVPTPERGYALDGGLPAIVSDIRKMRKLIGKLDENNATLKQRCEELERLVATTEQKRLTNYMNAQDLEAALKASREQYDQSYREWSAKLNKSDSDAGVWLAKLNAISTDFYYERDKLKRADETICSLVAECNRKGENIRGLESDLRITEIAVEKWRSDYAKLEAELATLRAEHKPSTKECDRYGHAFQGGDKCVECGVAKELPPLPAGEGWIELKSGEVILDGDEYWHCGTGPWKRITKETGGITIGGKLRDYHVAVRRKTIPPPAPAFVVDKPGVYRRRDGSVICVDKNTKPTYQQTHPWMASDGPTIRNDGMCALMDQPSRFDLVAYLAPLPPNNAPLLQVKPGDKLPAKFWYCTPRNGKGWQPWMLSGSKAQCDCIYAEYSELKPLKPITHWVEFAVSGREGV